MPLPRIKFKINQVPPSYNRHFKINYPLRHVYITKEAKEFKKQVFLTCPPMETSPHSIYRVLISVCNNWLYKNGKIKKQDIHNMDKFLIDAMCSKLGFDDSQIWAVHMVKVQGVGDEEWTEVTLEEV